MMLLYEGTHSCEDYSKLMSRKLRRHLLLQPFGLRVLRNDHDMSVSGNINVNSGASTAPCDTMPITE